MNELIESIKTLDKPQAKNLKYIVEEAINCIRNNIYDAERKDELYHMIDEISSACKTRIIELANREIENN